MHRDFWEGIPKYKLWLKPCIGNLYKYYCKFCEKFMFARKNIFHTHLASLKHIIIVEVKTNLQSRENIFYYRMLTLTGIAEITISACSASQNLSFNLADFLIPT